MFKKIKEKLKQKSYKKYKNLYAIEIAYRLKREERHRKHYGRAWPYIKRDIFEYYSRKLGVPDELLDSEFKKLVNKYKRELSLKKMEQILKI